MTVAFDAVSGSTIDTLFTDDFSWSHVPVGTPRGVYVVVQCGGAEETITVDYGALPMTALSIIVSANYSEGGVQRLYPFFLGSSVPTGSQTVSVVKSGAGNAFASAWSVTAAADVVVEATHSGIDSGAAANPSSSIALGGETCFVGMQFVTGQGAAANITPLTNWTSRIESDFGSVMMGAYSYDIIGSTDVTYGWTQTSDDAFAIAFALTEAAGGAQEVDGTGDFAVELAIESAGTGSVPQLADGVGAFEVSIEVASAGEGGLAQLVFDGGGEVEWGVGIEVASAGDGTVETIVGDVAGVGAFAIQLDIASAGVGQAAESQAVSGEGAFAVELVLASAGEGMARELPPPITSSGQQYYRFGFGA